MTESIKESKTKPIAPKIVDGNNLIFGRMATSVAKNLLNGEHVYIINAENIMISGNKTRIVSRYLSRRKLKNKADPEKSPHYPRVPYLLVKRMIRTMLPWKKSKGKAAYKRLKVFNKNSESLESNYEIAGAKKEIASGISIKGLCKELGYDRSY